MTLVWNGHLSVFSSKKGHFIYLIQQATITNVFSFFCQSFFFSCGNEIAGEDFFSSYLLAVDDAINNLGVADNIFISFYMIHFLIGL